MVTAVKARPNHYEVLGLERGASVEEIARAFARKMGLGAKPVGATAQLCTAYETLRDPERRRAYDEALEPKPEANAWGIAASRWSGGPYMMSAAASPAPAHPPKSRPKPPAPFIAAPLREVASTDAPPSRAQELLRRLEEQRREPEPAPTAAAPAVSDHVLLRAVEERLGEAERVPGEWSRTPLLVGALFVGVTLAGAWAGTVAGGHAEAAKAEPAVTLALPKAKPPAQTAVPPASPVGQAQAPAVRRAAKPSAVSVPVEAEAPAEASFEQASVAEAPVALAEMPLPAAVVSRTIERIGYPCGGIASSAPVEGSAGVFTVTCASGHSYRASPVRGRYHFRRLGSR